MSDIFREIEDELRRENLQQLWTRYGKYLIALAVVAVIATAGFMGWRSYEQRQHEAEGARFAAAATLLGQGKSAEAAAAFGELAQQSGGGGAAIARLAQADAEIDAGNAAGAIAIYDQLSTDQSIDTIFRDDATLLWARYSLEKGDTKAVIQRLQPLTNAASPWHGLALEMSAVAELKAGNKAKALSDFKLLSKDNTVPAGVRQRAIAMQEALAP